MVRPGGAADFLHDAADLFARQHAGQETLGGFIGAHQGAGARHLADEIDQQLFDQGGADRAEIGHDLGDFLDLLLVHHLPDPFGVIFTQRQHDNGGAFGAGQRADIFFDLDLGFGHGLNRLMQPGADDRERFFGMRRNHFTDFLDRGSAHLAVDAADVDAGARAGNCAGAPSAPAACSADAMAGEGSAPATGETPASAVAPGPAVWAANMRFIRVLRRTGPSTGR